MSTVYPVNIVNNKINDSEFVCFHFTCRCRLIIPKVVYLFIGGNIPSNIIAVVYWYYIQ